MNRNEIQNQIEDLKKQMAELEEQLNNPETKIFKPKKNDEYYIITNKASIDDDVWLDNAVDNARYDIGNCFETAEEAEFEIEKGKVTAELKRFAIEHNEPIDWNDPAACKYTICSDMLIEHNIEFASTGRFKRNDIYFSSKELARQAVAEVGEDRVKKYYLEVED